VRGKLEIGQPGDRYEQEADQVAAQVMTMPESNPNQSIQREIEPGEKKEEEIQTLSLSPLSAPLVQRTLKEDMQGQWQSALVELNSAYSGAGGVVGRQMRAVEDFTDAAAEQDQPSMGEQLLLGGINLLLNAALGGVGTALKAVATKALRPALKAATRATMGTAVESSAVRSTIRTSVSQIIDKMVDAGKDKLQSAVADAWRNVGVSAPTPLLQFRQTQMQALETIAREQVRVMNMQLAALRNTEGEEDEWEAANALYESFQQSLAQVYDQQYNKMTDIWFTMQVQSIGLGARPGVLQISLADRYPDKGSFRITGGNLLGSGANESIRSRLAGRPLKEIAIPKVIRMNGSMGYGILDCIWDIEVTGQKPPSAYPTISAPASKVEKLMAGPQRVAAWNGNKWGLPWLAAFNLGLNDLDSDDSRNTLENQAAGALKVWDAIKDLTPSSIGSSSW
jgi:hypothetical protein